MGVRLLLALLATTLLACAPAAADSYDAMSGDGLHQMGGLDGKNWGTWVSAGAVKNRCEWSVRSVSSSRPAEILDQGSAGVGEKVTVDINPDGSTGMSGMIGDHRIVFQTKGCGEWVRDR